MRFINSASAAGLIWKSGVLATAARTQKVAQAVPGGKKSEGTGESTVSSVCLCIVDAVGTYALP